MKLKFLVLLLVGLLAMSVTGCGGEQGGKDGESNEVYVYSWGDYIDYETLKSFENATGIHVVFDEFDTNESMYPRVAEGAVHYDVICPSDYMIHKMISNGLLRPLDFSKLPNAKEYIGEEFYKQSETFDPGNKYSVPYCWGTVGIIYDKTKVTEPVDSWNILWNEKYAGQILMQDSARDSMMVPLKLMGKSMNETDKEVLNQAQEMLIQQKPLVQAYVIDEVKEKMINSEATLAVVYSGEALIILQENPNMAFAIPKEGTNLWIDSWVITKDAKNVENAHKFIDFMCRPDVAVMNFDYLGYSTPNKAVKDLETNEEIKNSPIAFPSPETYKNQETFKYLGNDMDEYYNSLWMKIKVNN
ncbi:MAG: ABC transporter substrate-binding protein [Selenomonadaceae bacterium]|nr:ABC transporter substrate-binding protein [Selenomonadaceae bacterium]